MRVGTRTGTGASAYLLSAVTIVLLCYIVREPFSCVILQDTDVLLVCDVDLLECPLSDSIRLFDRFVDT